MKVILKKDVQSIGDSGDIVEVSDGYARNYLLPSNIAEIATPGALKNREKNIARIKAKAEKLHATALEVAEKIKTIGQIEISAKAGDNGKLFGAVTTKRLAEIIQEKLELEVDRKNITLNKPINHIGEYVMTLKLTSKVEVSLPIAVSQAEVVREELAAE